MKLRNYNLILVFFFSIIFPQESAREISLGGSVVTLSRGVFSVGINPANLAFSKENITLINSNFTLYNNLISLKVYNDLNGVNLEDNNSQITKNEFFEILNGNSFKLYNFINASLPGLNYLNSKYALTTKIKQFSKIDFGNEFFEIFLFGNKWQEEIDINFKISSQAVAEYGYSSWLNLEGLALGYTLKYLQGLYLYELTALEKDNYLYTDSTGLDMNITTKEEIYLGGSGFGIDIGINLNELSRGYSVGLSITNILGYINWDKNNLNYLFFGKNTLKKQNINAYKTKVNILSINNFNASDLMTGSTGIADSILFDTSYVEPLEYSVRKTDHPSILRFGISKNFEKKINIAYESRTKLNHTDLNDYIWIHSLGLEILKWKNIPIRFGISSGNKFNHRFSFGSGLYINNIRFDIGASWIGSRQLYHANGFDFGISLSINN